MEEAGATARDRVLLAWDCPQPTSRGHGAASAAKARRRRRTVRWAWRSTGSTGFTLIESLAALGLSATLVATLFPVYWHVTRGALLAHQHSMGTMLAAQRLEQLRGLTYRFDDTPAGPERTTDLATALSGASMGQSGPGLAPSPPGTLVVSTPGYVDYLDAEGRWAGDGAIAPPGAAFVRRWAVTPSLSDPDDGLMLQVVVATLADEQRDGPRVDAKRRPGDVWLALFRARVL